MSLFDKFERDIDKEMITKLQDTIQELCMDTKEGDFSIETAKKLAILSTTFYNALLFSNRGDLSVNIVSNVVVDPGESDDEDDYTCRTVSRIMVFNPYEGYRFEELHNTIIN